MDKAFDNMQHTFLVKTQQTRNRRELPQLDKDH